MNLRPNTVIAISVAIACAIFSITAWVLIQMRHDVIRGAQEAAFNVALLVERDTARSLEMYDLSLQALINGLQHRGVMNLPPTLRQFLLFDHSATAQDMGSLLVIDETGKVVIDSKSVPPRSIYVADRDYFKVHRDSPNLGLYISHPFIPRTEDDGISIALSRRMSYPDGSFAGVVVGTMRLNYFRNLFVGMKLGTGGSMAIMLADGTMLMRLPYNINVIGKSLKDTPNFTRFTQASTGHFFGTATIDGVPRWYTFRHVNKFPLIIDVALATQDIYAAWSHRAWIIGLLVGSVDVLIIIFALMFAKQLRHRLATEIELRTLARIDGLTGLYNRRTFDEIVQIEWCRAQRKTLPLSLLLIDVDHFKDFNDTYGHTAGDDTLVAVAQCLADATRRPGDTAARYGGEEFVVLLPDTGEAGAALVAENIRMSVQALGHHHVGSAHRVVTVSVGIACTTEQSFATLRAFVDRADSALYHAKDMGRNQVARKQALQ